MIRNIIFDFGNVFIEWDPRRIFKQTVPAERLEGFMQTVWREEWNNNLDQGMSFADNGKRLSVEEPQHGEYIRFFHEHWYDSLGDENPESLAILRELNSAGYHTYGLSNWSAETFPPTRKAHPFFNELHGIVISGEVGVCKPNPEIYRILLNRYNMQPEECVFIDDRQENLLPAHRMGMATVQFRSAAQVRQELKKLKINIL